MGDAHKEALGIADDRWARIFNHNRLAVGRTDSPLYLNSVWGKPQDMSQHP